MRFEKGISRVILRKQKHLGIEYTHTHTMGEQVQRMDSFRLLLNEISHQLTEQNLQSLIHIYNVPGGMRKQMNGGLALFGYMITQDFISREKIGNLRHLMRKLRPRRKDLVRLVDDYIKNEFQTDDVRLVLDDFSESWEQIAENKGGSPVSHDETALCKIDCAYLNCVCRRVPSCYAPIIALLLIAIIATTVFWYADVPKISNSINSNPELKRAGVYIVILQILALLFVIGFRIRRTLASCLACRNPGYGVLVNPSIQEGTSKRMAPISTSASTSALQGVASAPRPYRISGSESAVFSCASGEPGSMPSTFGTFEPDSSGPEA